MTLKTIGGRFVVEVSRVHAFVKIGRYEIFVDFERGAAERVVSSME